MRPAWRKSRSRSRNWRKRWPPRRPELKEAETALPELDAARAQHTRELEAARKALHQTEAELAALKKLQESLKADEKLGAWLRSRGLDAAPRLWEKLRVAPGWEAAVEAVLRERLQAVAADAQPDWFADAPPARLTRLGRAGRGGSGRAGTARQQDRQRRCRRPRGARRLARPASTGPTTRTPRAPAAPASQPANAWSPRRAICSPATASPSMARTRRSKASSRAGANSNG